MNREELISRGLITPATAALDEPTRQQILEGALPMGDVLPSLRNAKLTSQLYSGPTHAQRDAQERERERQRARRRTRKRRNV